jgi:hypothetical protein
LFFKYCASDPLETLKRIKKLKTKFSYNKKKITKKSFFTQIRFLMYRLKANKTSFQPKRIFRHQRRPEMLESSPKIPDGDKYDFDCATELDLCQKF